MTCVGVLVSQDVSSGVAVLGYSGAGVHFAFADSTFADNSNAGTMAAYAPLKFDNGCQAPVLREKP